MPYLPPAYRAHDAYIAPARRRAEVWRLLPGSLVVLAFYMGPLILLSVYLGLAYGPLIADQVAQGVIAGATPGAMLTVLYSFGGLALGAMAAVRLVHGRRAGTLLGPDPRATWRDFVTVALPLLGFQLFLGALALSDPAVMPGLTWWSFLGYMPFALPGILVQCAAEELVFRGYLQQQLAARVRNPLVWMGLPSALFAFGHYLPDEFGAGALMIVLWAFVFGCLAADLTARTGSIGAAVAFHMASNVSAMLIVGLAGNLDGLALWTIAVDFDSGDQFAVLLAADFLIMLCAWLIARIALRR